MERRARPPQTRDCRLEFKPDTDVGRLALKPPSAQTDGDFVGKSFAQLRVLFKQRGFASTAA